MGFTITASAECRYCGNLLSSSDEDCDQCSWETRDCHLFRRIGSANLYAVYATFEHRWEAFRDRITDDWRAWEYLGTRSLVQAMLDGTIFDSVEDLPRRELSIDAPIEPES